jgi:ATP-binding cassette subfamily F protein 3
MLISHDRDFLDAVVGHIAHIEQEGIQLYSGNYSAFERIRAERLANQQAAHARQQREIAHVRNYIDRFRAKATKARQAQRRLKALERMELIAPAHVDSPFHFGFMSPEKTPNPLLRLEGVTAGYEAVPVIRGVGLNLRPGDRIGLLGPNGAGKSTLIKLLAGELKPLDGDCVRAADLNLGYFAQHQLEQLCGGDTPLLHLQRLAPKATEQELRDFLGGFGFHGDRALEPVAPLSGGEKARLVLALLVYRRPNLLLLDEPTNHLDLEMRHALSQALQDYEGALVIVSHDRHLLRTNTDQLLLVHGGGVEEFAVDLDEYPRWLSEQRREMEPKETVMGEHSAAARKDKKRQEAERRRQLQPLRMRLKRLEDEMESLGARSADLEAQLAMPEIYEDAGKDRLKGVLAEKAEVDRALSQVESDWLAAGEALEAAERMV